MRVPFRRLVFALLLALAAPAQAQLTEADVTKVIRQGVTRATVISPNSVIAVVDREGYVLTVWSVNGGEPTPGEIAAAVSKAGTLCRPIAGWRSHTTEGISKVPVRCS
ncbi:hypothetical protein BH20VER1_BH20VER1_23520 [soil metagenome]